MSTEINITVGPQSLVDRNRQEVQGNRFSRAEQDAQKRTEATARESRQRQLAQQGLTADGQAQYGNPSRPQFMRQKPAAFRYGGDSLLLLHMDGSDGSTLFIDSSRRRLPVTVNGNAQISTSQSKFGGASGLFDGDGDWLSVSNTSLALGTGDFTIEAWVRVPSAATFRGYMGICVYPGLGDDTGTFLYAYTNTCSFLWYDGIQGEYAESVRFSFDEWAHVAAVRRSEIIYLYLNGVLQVETYSDQPPINSPNVLVGRSEYGPGEFMYGNIDELRISAKAVYTENFTPSNRPFI